MIQFIDNQ